LWRDGGIGRFDFEEVAFQKIVSFCFCDLLALVGFGCLFIAWV
jgi:hypothetical protein